MSHPVLTTWQHESLQPSSMCSSVTINHFTYPSLFFCNSLVPETCVFPMLYHLSIFWACSISSLLFSKSFCLFCVLCFAFPSKSSFKLLKVWYSWMQQFSNLKEQGTPSITYKTSLSSQNKLKDFVKFLQLSHVEISICHVTVMFQTMTDTSMNQSGCADVCFLLSQKTILLS